MHRLWKREPVNRKTFLHYHNILVDTLPFYAALKPLYQAVFLHRTLDLLDTKSVIGREGLKITDEIRLRVMATMVQLTFGLRQYHFPNISQIVVMPDVFYNKLMDVHLRGGTSPNGTIFFSWKHFEHGYEIPDDRMNLGLHEVAHAFQLWLEQARKRNKTLSNYFDAWMELAEAERKRMKAGHPSFFRKYAKTNNKEFFAVAVEHFFEAAHDFKEQMPQLYQHICLLLNMDLTRPENNFWVNPAVKKDWRKSSKKLPLAPSKLNRLSYSIALVSMVIGLGGGMPYILAGWEDMAAPWAWWVIGLLLIGGLALYPLLKSRQIDQNVMGVLMVFLWLPFSFGTLMRMEQQYPQSVEEEVMEVKGWTFSERAYHLRITDAQYAAIAHYTDPNSATGSIPKWLQPKTVATMKLQVAHGYFGSRRILKREFVPIED